MKAAYIGGIQRFSTEDGPGIRTTVFVKGCPLKCQWCHNPELLDPAYGVMYRQKDCILCGRCLKACPAEALSSDGERIVIDRERCRQCGACVKACVSGALFTKSIAYEMEDLMARLAKDRDYYESSGGGITLSGGEILSHGEYAIDLAQAIRDAGLTLAIETSGWGPWEDLEALAEASQYILFDLKHMDPEQHKKYVGVSPEKICGNLEKLAANPVPRDQITIRVPLIHGVNDSAENILAVADYMEALGLKRVDLLPYHQMGLSKAREAGLVQEAFETPPDEVLETLRGLLADRGLQVVVMGHEDN